MLHSKNYGMWKIRQKGLLDDLDLLDYVDGTFDSSWLSKTSDDEAIKKELQNHVRKDRKAWNKILRFVSDDLIQLVADTHSAREAWLKLEAHFESKSNQNMVFTLQRLLALRFREGDSLTKHVSEIKGLYKQLIDMMSRDKCESQLLVALILLSLPPSYQPLVKALQVRSGVLTVDIVTEYLFSEEQLRSHVSSGHNGRPSPSLSSSSDANHFHVDRAGAD